MSENTVKLNIAFQALTEAISTLEVTQKQELWEILDAELFPEDEYSPEDIAEIQAARDDYKSGSYITFDQYMLERGNHSNFCDTNT